MRTSDKSPEFLHWKQIAKTNEVTMAAFNYRVKKGWDYERAATEPVRQRAEPQIELIIEKDVTKPKLRLIPKELYKVAASNGIDRETVLERVFQLHWEPEKAVTEPVETAVINI